MIRVLSSTEYLLAGICGVIALVGMTVLLVPHVRTHGTYTAHKGVYVLFALTLLAVMYFFYPLIHSTIYGTYQALAERINNCCSVGPWWDSLGSEYGYAIGGYFLEKLGFLGAIPAAIALFMSFIGLILWTIAWLALLIAHAVIVAGFTYHVLPAALVVLVARWPGYPLLVYGLLGGYFLVRGAGWAAFQTAVAVSRHPAERELGGDRRRWHTRPTRTLKKSFTDIRKDPVPPAWRSRMYKVRLDRLTDLLRSEERFLHSFRRYKKRRMDES